jgi:hypothetical protein
MIEYAEPKELKRLRPRSNLPFDRREKHITSADLRDDQKERTTGQHEITIRLRVGKKESAAQKYAASSR